MLLPKAFIRKQNGFTIIEIAIAVGIFALITAFSLVSGFQFYRTYAFNAQRDLIVSNLEKARNDSLDNFHQTSHGVCYDDSAKNYVIFEGLSCAAGSNKQLVPGSPAVTITWPNDIVFKQLEGSTTLDCNASPGACTIHLTDGIAHSIDIIINNEGRISW